MFVVAEIQGNQYFLSEGQTVRTQRIFLPQGEKVTFDTILLVSESSATHIGTPYVLGYHVECEILGEGKGDKIHVFKMKAKKRYRRTQGHRQYYTDLKVLKIVQGSVPKKETVTKGDTQEDFMKEIPEKVIKTASEDVQEVPRKKKTKISEISDSKILETKEPKTRKPRISAKKK
ncbi:50S ribosomal protein L21 [Candidatus Peregrinibacteria bacterium]|nr:50S ribosomal protein L21 [Candidatus Peregrinibacteria bacterium]